MQSTNGENMNILKAAAIVATLLFAAPAVAGTEDAHKPKYGGIVREVKGIQYELVAKPDSIAIYVEDHGKKVGTKGATATLTLLSGKEKSETPLTPSGENALEAKGSFKLAPGTRVVAVVTLSGRPATSVRFAVKQGETKR
jgi:hypothetical protein